MLNLDGFGQYFVATIETVRQMMVTVSRIMFDAYEEPKKLKFISAFKVN